MIKVPPHFAHQQYHDQSHYGPAFGQHYVHYGLPVQNQYHQYQMQPQHHVIRNPSPMQQAQQPPPPQVQSVAQSQAPSVATQPVTVATQQQQSPQQIAPVGVVTPPAQQQNTLHSPQQQAEDTTPPKGKFHTVCFIFYFQIG